jgi:hypothetical protein
MLYGGYVWQAIAGHSWSWSVDSCHFCRTRGYPLALAVSARFAAHRADVTVTEWLRQIGPHRVRLHGHLPKPCRVGRPGYVMEALGDLPLSVAYERLAGMVAHAR